MMTATDKIIAPWTSDQVDRLNRFQRLGYMHEFTCPDSHDGADRTLVATKAGWICPHCDYRQDWAHAMMLDVPPEPPERKCGHPIQSRAGTGSISSDGSGQMNWYCTICGSHWSETWPRKAGASP